MGIGVLASGSFMLTLLAYIVIALVAVAVDLVLDFGPPGPYFFVLMAAAGATVLGNNVPLGVLLATMAAGSALAMAFALADEWYAPHAVEGRAIAKARENSVDPLHSALGPPGLAYRVPYACTWPSLTLITLSRMVLAIVVATTITHVARDHHPFWATLVVTLVLMYPGTPDALVLRAAQRFLGTVVGIGAFAALGLLHLGASAYLALLCVLLFASARVTSRNYLYGTVFITLLALYLTVPLAPAETPRAIALDRLEDTIVAVVLAAAAVGLVGPHFTPALARESARRIARASIAVLDCVLDRRQPVETPGFVEGRRRLQYALLHARDATSLATSTALRDAASCIELQRSCERLGYRVLEVSTPPVDARKRRELLALRSRLVATAAEATTHRADRR